MERLTKGPQHCRPSVKHASGASVPTNSGKTVVTRNLLSLVKVADKMDKSLLVCYRSIAHQGNVALRGGADVSQRIQGAAAIVGF